MNIDMKASKKIRNTVIITILIVCILLFFCFIPTQKSLVFYKENSDDIAAFLPVSSGQAFQITFTHSIHLTDVVEKYRVTDDNQIEQYEIVYEEFGIGMPSNAEEGETFVHEDGKYYIKDLQQFFPSMNIRNGKTVSEHRFDWKDANENRHRVLFNDYFEPGAWFKVKVTKLSLMQTWKEVKIHD